MTKIWMSEDFSGGMQWKTRCAAWIGKKWAALGANGMRGAVPRPLVLAYDTAMAKIQRTAGAEAGVLAAKLAVILATSTDPSPTWDLLDASGSGARLAAGFWIERGWVRRCERCGSRQEDEWRRFSYVEDQWDWPRFLNRYVKDPKCWSEKVIGFLERDRSGSRWLYVSLDAHGEQSKSKLPGSAVYFFRDGNLVRAEYVRRSAMPLQLQHEEPATAEQARQEVLQRHGDEEHWISVLLLHRLEKMSATEEDNDRARDAIAKTFDELMPLYQDVRRPDSRRIPGAPREEPGAPR